MEAFGYDKKDKEFDNILELSQVTLSCRKEDLDNIINFLTEIKKEAENISIIDDEEHWHYRDYNDTWNEKEPDVIIYLDNDTVK